VTAPNGFAVMAFDVPPGRAYAAGTDAVYVSVRGTDTEEVTGYWQALTAGGTVRADLAPAGYAPLYGMVTDRFGVTWVLDVLPLYNGWPVERRVGAQLHHVEAGGRRRPGVVAPTDYGATARGVAVPARCR